METNVKKLRWWGSEINHPQYKLWQIKQPENVEYFSSLGNTIKNRARLIAVIKGAFNEKKFIFAREMELNLKKKVDVLYLERNFVWCWKLDTSESRS